MGVSSIFSGRRLAHTVAYAYYNVVVPKYDFRLLAHNLCFGFGLGLRILGKLGFSLMQPFMYNLFSAKIKDPHLLYLPERDYG